MQPPAVAVVIPTRNRAEYLDGALVSLGVRATSAPLIAFLDDDVDAPAGWLRALVDGAERHSDADAFGGPIRARFEGRTPSSCGREKPPITTLDLGSEDRETEMVWGAKLAIRRRTFDRIGPFAESVSAHWGMLQVFLANCGRWPDAPGTPSIFVCPQGAIMGAHSAGRVVEALRHGCRMAMT